MTTTITPWPIALAARKRQRAAEAFQAAQDWHRQAEAARDRATRRILRAQARRCRLIALSLLREARELDPIPLEVDAATVATRRADRRCACCVVARTTRGGVVCAACGRRSRFCWACGRVRRLDAFWGACRVCSDCGKLRDRRPRKGPEAAAEARRAVIARAGQAYRERAKARRAAVVQAVLGAGGVPSPAPAAFWAGIGAAQTPQISGEAARSLHQQAMRRQEVQP